MTRDEAVRVAVNLLSNIYRDDMSAAACISLAHAKYLDGKGCGELRDLLCDIRPFIDKLIAALDDEPKEKKEDKT